MDEAATQLVESKKTDSRQIAETANVSSTIDLSTKTFEFESHHVDQYFE